MSSFSPLSHSTECLLLTVECVRSVDFNFLARLFLSLMSRRLESTLCAYEKPPQMVRKSKLLYDLRATSNSNKYCIIVFSSSRNPTLFLFALGRNYNNSFQRHCSFSYHTSDDET